MIIYSKGEIYHDNLVRRCMRRFILNGEESFLSKRWVQTKSQAERKLALYVKVEQTRWWLEELRA